MLNYINQEHTDDIALQIHESPCFFALQFCRSQVGWVFLSEMISAITTLLVRGTDAMSMF
jgi:hypothetical protein